MRKITSHKAFTLIELLIVVAIIAILAAIAVPNFLEAQTRSKISRVKADMRSLATALEAYAVDNNRMPILRGYLNFSVGQWNRGGINNVHDLTTPVAYITSVNVLDPFSPPASANVVGDYYEERTGFPVSLYLCYVNIDLARSESGRQPINTKWVLVSYGPDKRRGPCPQIAEMGVGDYCRPDELNWFLDTYYDATNGTRSGGDIINYQGRGFN